MKIAITGHTRGIGKALADVFTAGQHTVIGFSKSTGFDIGDPNAIKEIADFSEDCDVFINNAFHYQGQFDLLKEMIKRWDGTSKMIINLNTKAKFLGDEGINEFLSMMPDPIYLKTYIESKKWQDRLVKSRLAIGTPQILDVSPGPVDTDMGKVFNCKKLDATDIAELIYHSVLIRDKVSIRELVLDVPNITWTDIKPRKPS
jgi:NADP-dependent 3-hydroxy acid dehydrogenase YdfG